MFSIYEKQWQFLVKSAALGKLSHAYLFSGRPALAKEEVAREFAKLVNCQSPDFETKSCGRCPSCVEMVKGLHPDFLWLEPDQDEESQINLIRSLTEWLSLKPGLANYKVAVINHLENFSLASQSSFLKTLEEPTGQAVLMIISDYPDLLLPTIISRSQEIKFPPQAMKQIGEEKMTDWVGKTETPLAVYFQRLKEVSEDKETALRFLQNLMVFFRGEFLKKVLSENEREKTALPVWKIKNFLLAAEKTNYLLRRTNVNTRLALENLILKLF